MGKSRFRRASQGWNKYRNHTSDELIERHSNKIFKDVANYSVIYPPVVVDRIREYTKSEAVCHLFDSILRRVEHLFEEQRQDCMNRLGISEEEREQTGLKRIVLVR